MNIMYACDDKFVEILAVSVQSLLNSNAGEQFEFYLVEDNVSEINKNKLKKIITKSGNHIHFIVKPDIRRLIGLEVKTLRWSDSAYSRLFLREILVDYPNVEKLLYMDCDTLVVGKIRPLWEMDVEDYLGAACLECMSNMHKKIIGAKKKDNYVNTGMMLLNVKRWVDENIEDVVIAFIQKLKGKTEYVDQGVINGTVSNRLKLVSPRYNLTSLAYDFTYEEMQIYRKPQFGYSKIEWEEAIENPVIVHFTTSFLSIRPWYAESKHPYAAYWKEVHDITPWKNEPWRELKNREFRNCIEKIYRKMPRRIGLYIAGFLHAYIKPIIYVI